MTRNTNLDKCKNICKEFLLQELQMDPKYQFFLIHPIIEKNYFLFVNGKLYISNNQNIQDEKPKLINIMEEKNAYQQVIEWYTETIDNAKNYFELLYLVKQQYRLTFIKFTIDYLSKEDYGEGLIFAWTETEMPVLDANLSKQEYVNFFKKVDKKYLMEEYELEKYNSLDNAITIYRGVNKEYNNVEAISWTLSIDIAKIFAKRFSIEGIVYQAKINKENILAYINCRKEQEVIVDYTKLYDIEQIMYIKS